MAVINVCSAEGGGGGGVHAGTGVIIDKNDMFLGILSSLFGV